MELKLFRHLWGMERPWEQAFAAFAAEGFVGIETGLPDAAKEPLLRRLLTEHGFAYIPQIFTAGRTVEENADSFRRQLERAATFGPLLVNCHSGKDHFSRDENRRFYAEAMRIEKSLPFPVAHETHRGRTFFNPWATRDLLQEFPDLKLCCDYSHWVCVCERLLDGCDEILALAAERCLHVHARVGYPEGPQVPDPAAAEYGKAVEAHERWWDQIWEAHERQARAWTSLTPEFGPPAYLHTLPHTNVPVADLWEVCHWQARRQRQRFAQRKPARAS